MKKLLILLLLIPSLVFADCVNGYGTECDGYGYKR